MKLIAYGEEVECTSVEKGDNYLKVFMDGMLIREDSGINNFSGYSLVDEDGNSVPWVSMEDLKSKKLQEAGDACTQTIYDGIALTINDIEYKFSYNAEDQRNISDLKTAILLHAMGLSTDFDLSNGIPYHANGEKCIMWSQDDFNTISAALSLHKLQQTTYCNYLNTWIRRETDYDVLESIVYGCELPEDLATEMQSILTSSISNG